MLKKTITFEDFNGNTITEDFYFHLSKAEVTEMELSQKGGLTEYLKKIVAEEDGPKLVAMFKELLTKTVGKRSEDGRKFIKNQEIIDDFVQSEAYSELFVELASNAEMASEFVNGIMPTAMQAAVQAVQAKNVELPAVSDLPAISDIPAVSDTPSNQPSWITDGRTPTTAELQNATPEQIHLAFQRKQASQSEIAP